MADAQVLAIARVGLNVADLTEARGFYEAGLGFDWVRTERREGPDFADLVGLSGVTAEAAVFRLGAQEIELLAFDPPGRRYPRPWAANDLWFQHIAIVVSDMDEAYARLSRTGRTAISTGGPQLLPPSTGSVTAYKFRDPEGHPLELSHIPASEWAGSKAAANGAVFLGIDHSAIVVADLEASIAFFTALGMRLDARFLNSGPTQARLDGLKGALVDIVVMRPAQPGGPHLELLAYRAPAPAPATSELRPDDVAATRLILVVNNPAATLETVATQGGTAVSRGAATRPGSPASLARDPDGHLLEFRRGA